MSPFDQPDLVPLWDRPPEFLPERPPSGVHRWHYGDVRRQLAQVSTALDEGLAERRVALFAHPDLEDQATDGLHAGIQMLLPGESAAPHRHTPGALRIGLEADDTVTFVDDQVLRLDPLDVVLNPSGTWHGHTDRSGAGAVWLDVVDLPLVSAMGAVLFEPERREPSSPLLDPDQVPTTVAYPWARAEQALMAQADVDGVRELRYGEGAVLPTMAVTAYLVDEGATLVLPNRTCGSVVLAARGDFESPAGPVSEFDVVGLRSWTPFRLVSRAHGGVVMVVDTSPAARALGLYREEAG